MEKKPNILIITTDQQRYDTLGINNRIIQTPNLDRLALEGCHFDRAYSPNPVCIPARHNMLSGLTCKYHGFDDNDFSQIRSIPYYLPTFPQILSDAGYDTIGIGKLHHQPDRRHNGFHRYFMMDEIPRHREDDDYAIYLRDHGYPEVSALHGVRDPLYMIPQQSQVPIEHHGSTWVADVAIQQLKLNRGKRPFMFWLGFNHPHPPLDVPSEYANLYTGQAIPEATQSLTPLNWLAEENQNIVHYPNTAYLRRFKELYYASITYVDVQIGRILKELTSIGELDNTLIIFCSDHGEMLGDLGTYQKFLPHDASSRIPMIVRYPARIKAGTQSSAFVSLNDILPTTLDLTGLPYPADYPLSGQSLFKLNDRTYTVMEHGRNARRWLSIVNKNYKYAYYYGGGSEELYDMVNDPNEMTNCMVNPKPEHLVITSELRKQLIQWEMIHGLADHIENQDFKRFDIPTPLPFMGTGSLVFPSQIMDIEERKLILPLAKQILNAVKNEPVVHLEDIDFSYMIKNRQLSVDEVAEIIATDKETKNS